jgi:hypothetical protein
MKSLILIEPAANLVNKTILRIANLPVVKALVLAVSLVTMASITALSISGQTAFAKMGAAANPFVHLSLAQVQALDPNLRLPAVDSSFSRPRAQDYASKAEYHEALLKIGGVLPADLAGIDAQDKATFAESGISPAYAAIGLAPAAPSSSSGGANTSRGLRR